MDICCGGGCVGIAMDGNGVQVIIFWISAGGGNIWGLDGLAGAMAGPGLRFAASITRKNKFASCPEKELFFKVAH